jgi:predicted nuclease of predicted toxin-antitoxin system
MKVLLDANLSYRLVKKLSDIFLNAFMFHEQGYQFPPPKVVLLRTGNKTTQEVADLLRYHANELTSFASSQDTDLLEIYF